MLFQRHRASGTGAAAFAGIAALHASRDAQRHRCRRADGAFEFHSWGASFLASTVPTGSRSTRSRSRNAVVDVREACELTRALLDRLALNWFPKTTGGKGLHFVLPLGRRYDWDAVKTFARALATETGAERAVDVHHEVSKRERGGRVLSIICAMPKARPRSPHYSLRARPGLPVSMPIP